MVCFGVVDRNLKGVFVYVYSYSLVRGREIIGGKLIWFFLRFRIVYGIFVFKFGENFCCSLFRGKGLEVFRVF